MKCKNLAIVGLVVSLSLPLMPVVSARETSHASTWSEVAPNRNFQKCASGTAEPPEVLTVGESLGPGITEPLTDEIRSSLEENAFEVPSSAIGVRHLDTGESVFVDEVGAKAGSLSDQAHYSEPGVEPYGLIPDEAKRLIGACLGVSWESGPLAEAIFRQIYDVRSAIKFIIRRIGLGAAIGCVGGIIWEYI